jgi:dynein heavy chain
LKKVFENMNLIEFDEGKQIVAMFSAEGERVRFVNNVDPRGKNVEDWMGLLEEEMMQSVRAALLRSVEQYPYTLRQSWVLEHPGQCVLNGSQIIWTKDVEKAIASVTLRDYLATLDS